MTRPRKPMRRAGGLSNGNPLQRKTEMPRASEPVARGPVKPRRQRDTGPVKSVRDLVKQRAGFACEICGTWLGPLGGEIHHRAGRKMGGTRRTTINLPSNLLYLCPPHHLMVTDTKGMRREYERAGWLVREGAEPIGVPVKLSMVGRRYLDNEGGYLPLADKKIGEVA